MRNVNGAFFRMRRCRYCGSTSLASGDHDDICAECQFWLDIINCSPTNIHIVGDTCYRILPYVEDPLPGAILGNNGKTFYYMANDKSVIKSNDVWTLGKIPVRFAQKLAPTGYFIDRSLYKKLSEGVFECEAIGCYDRYHCLLYDYRQEFDMPHPFNKVPLRWHTGDENCPSFINILRIPGFNPTSPEDVL